MQLESELVMIINFLQKVLFSAKRPDVQLRIKQAFFKRELDFWLKWNRISKSFRLFFKVKSNKDR